MKKEFSFKGIFDRFSSLPAEGSPLFHWSFFLFTAFLGTFILFKPAAGLRGCALLFLLPAGMGAAWLYRKVPVPYRYMAWGIVPAVLMIMYFFPHWDTGALLFTELFLLLAAGRLLRSRTFFDKVAGSTAGVAALMLLFQMFRCGWFDLYTGVALVFWGAALRELGMLRIFPGKKSRC